MNGHPAAYWHALSEARAAELRTQFNALCRQCSYRKGTRCRIGYEPVGVAASRRNCVLLKGKIKL